jgi:hypothetical protein
MVDAKKAHPIGVMPDETPGRVETSRVSRDFHDYAHGEEKGVRSLPGIGPPIEVASCPNESLTI